MKYNFIHKSTGRKIKVSRYTAKYENGEVVYYDKQGYKLDIEKIETKPEIQAIRTETKNR